MQQNVQTYDFFLYVLYAGHQFPCKNIVWQMKI